MSVRPATLARTAPVSAGRAALRGFLEREGIFGWLMLAPGVLFLLAFVAYPFFYGIFLSLQDRRVATQGTFVGFANFLTLARDEVFWQVVRNTFVYVAATTVLKLVGGLAMALVMNQYFRGRNLVRAFLLLPFIVPTALSTVAWMWILDPTFSVVNWLLVNLGDIQLIYTLTHGGPANATHVFSTWSFDIGMSAGQLGMGAAVALAILPALAVLIVALTFYLRRE